MIRDIFLKFFARDIKIYNKDLSFSWDIFSELPTEVAIPWVVPISSKQAPTENATAGGWHRNLCGHQGRKCRGDVQTVKPCSQGPGTGAGEGAGEEGAAWDVGEVHSR